MTTRTISSQRERVRPLRVHEMGIVDGVLTSAVSAAEDAGATRIVSVQVDAGILTGVVADAMQFAWEALTPGTMAEGALLEIRFIEASSRCMECGHEFVHDRFGGARCPACDSALVALLTGRELKIASIDIDD